jgi:hypothetical protein
MGMIYINGIPEEFTGHLDDYTGRNIHRVDGPAIDWVDGRKAWCIAGLYYSFEDFLKQLPEEEAMLLALEWK